MFHADQSLCQDIPGPDQLLRDVVANIKHDGICKHFSELFWRGRGLHGHVSEPVILRRHVLFTTLIDQALSFRAGAEIIADVGPHHG